MTQTSQRNDFTRRIICQHIKPGMRVLDVGCGSGDASFLLSEAVGSSGMVDGIDTNRDAIGAALKRQDASGRQNVSFSVADLNGIAADGRGGYDAIFGRRVLMYQPDPLRTICTLRKALKPGAIMLFQESDETGSLLNGDRLPLHRRVQDWIWDTVRFEGGHTHIGSELYGIMKAAKMRVTDYRAEAVLQTVESGSDLAWVASMMEERIKAAGITASTEGLEERLTAEMRDASHAFVRDLAYGICAQKQ